jgi:hypothetical protein
VYRDEGEAVEVGKDDAGCEIRIKHCGTYDGIALDMMVTVIGIEGGFVIK